MIETLLLLLSTIASGDDVCALGEPIDYYAYVETAPFPETFIHSDELWIDVYENGIVYIDLNGVEGSDGHPHGECAIALQGFKND